MLEEQFRVIRRISPARFTTRPGTTLGTTLANTGALGALDAALGTAVAAADATSFIHRYADDAQTPIRSATTRAVSPEDRTSAISRSRSSTVCRRRMHPLLQGSAPDHRWAWRIGYEV